MLHIIKTRKIWLSISAVLMVIGIVSIAVFGLKLGIDFTGGSILEVEYHEQAPSAQEVRNIFEQHSIRGLEVKKAQGNALILRFQTVSEEQHQEVLDTLREKGELDERSFNSIGPVIGAELATKSIWALISALAMILIFITFAFRKVSKKIASWKYGAVAIITLFHDLIFVVGAFAILGRFGGVGVTSAFIAAFLTILGYSVNDTIVVFDRIRENLLRRGDEFEEIVNKSVNETIMRSVNTSVTVIFVLVAIYFFGGETLKNFALALILGIGIGTYSSIFVASPLLVVWQLRTKLKKN